VRQVWDSLHQAGGATSRRYARADSFCGVHLAPLAIVGQITRSYCAIAIAVARPRCVCTVVLPATTYLGTLATQQHNAGPLIAPSRGG
jgi:hypothetical protein